MAEKIGLTRDDMTRSIAVIDVIEIIDIIDGIDELSMMRDDLTRDVVWLFIYSVRRFFSL